MKIKLNVRVNLTNEDRLFTVWPNSHKFLPGIEFFTGMGKTTREAVDDLFAQLPEQFAIDDEFAVLTESIEHTLKRPFDIVRSESIRTFLLR